MGRSLSALIKLRCLKDLWPEIQNYWIFIAPSKVHKSVLVPSVLKCSLKNFWLSMQNQTSLNSRSICRKLGELFSKGSIIRLQSDLLWLRPKSQFRKSLFCVFSVCVLTYLLLSILFSTYYCFWGAYPYAEQELGDFLQQTCAITGLRVWEASSSFLPMNSPWRANLYLHITGFCFSCSPLF